jgi:GDP-4-dehydro-6-deoxy-D-mannose reductase
VSVRDLVELLGRVASLEVRAEVDPKRVRGHDVPEIRGSAKRLQDATDWRPEIPLEQTLADALAAWRERLPA